MRLPRLRLLSLFRKKTKTRVRRKRRVVSAPVSDPKLLSIWYQLRQQYFPSLPDLDSYTVAWSSRRQKRVLGSCHIQKKKVLVARELMPLECEIWLSPLLYHEMCHAALGANVERYKGKRAWHGPEFKALEARNSECEKLHAWISSGGWTKAVRSARARSAHASRSSQKVNSELFE